MKKYIVSAFLVLIALLSGVFWFFDQKDYYEREFEIEPVNDPLQTIQVVEGIQNSNNGGSEHFVESVNTVNIADETSLDNDVFELLDEVKSQVKSFAEKELKDWEQSSAEYYKQSRDGSMFVFLPKPDNELNTLVSNTIIEAFEDCGVSVDSLDSETIHIIKDLIEWPEGDRVLFAKAEKNKNDALIMLENVDAETVRTIRNIDNVEFDMGMIIHSGIIKLNVLNLEMKNKFSHLLGVEVEPGN